MIIIAVLSSVLISSIKLPWLIHKSSCCWRACLFISKTWKACINKFYLLLFDGVLFQSDCNQLPYCRTTSILASLLNYCNIEYYFFPFVVSSLMTNWHPTIITVIEQVIAKDLFIGSTPCSCITAYRLIIKLSNIHIVTIFSSYSYFNMNISDPSTPYLITVLHRAVVDIWREYICNKGKTSYNNVQQESSLQSIYTQIDSLVSLQSNLSNLAFHKPG